MAEPVNLLEDLYGLTRNPFEAMVATTLDPGRNPDDLSKFYNLYKWHTPTVIEGIDHASGLAHFETQQGDAPLLFVVCGYKHSGRTSLTNLIMRAIRNSTPKRVIEVSHEFQQASTNLRARELASKLIRRCRALGDQELTEEMKAILMQAVDFERATAGTGYLNIFQELGAAIRDAGQDVMFAIAAHGIDCIDDWETLHQSVAPIANYLVVITNNRVHTQAARGTLPGKGYQFGAISAPEIGSMDARCFIKQRLSHERKADAPVDELGPFHPSAIDALFQPTPGNEAKRWPIGWVINKLALALEKHLEDLADQDGAAGKALIDADSIGDYIDEDKRGIGSD